MHSVIPLRLGALLVAVVVVLALSAVVMAAAKPGDSGTSSNQVRPLAPTSDAPRAMRGSNGPPAVEASDAAQRPQGTNQLTTP